MPRIAETPSGMLNAIGLQNPGIKGFIRKYPKIWESWDVPAIVNISAESVADYAMMARLLDDVPGVAALEVNISCPNISAGGYCFGWDPVMSADVTRAVREATTLPMVVKLSPGAVDVIEIAQAVEDAGADAVSLINTLRAMAFEPRRGARARPWLGGGSGGLSGPAIRAVALAQVAAVARRVSVPIVGMGGVASGEHAWELLGAGATLVAVGTQSFRDPAAGARVATELKSLQNTKKPSTRVNMTEAQVEVHTNSVDSS